MKCKNCGIKLDNSAIYCEKCGVKVGKEDVIKLFSYSELMTQYYDLEYELGDIHEQISIQSSKEAYLQKLILKRDLLSNQLNIVQSVMQQEKKDYEDLLKVSFTSIKASLNQKMDEKKRKEEIEYLQALANYDHVEKEYNSLKDEINTIKKRIEHLHELKSRIPEIEKEMYNLLVDLTKGKTNQKLGELEQNYKKIHDELNTIKIDEDLNKKAIQLLGNGKNHLGKALKKIGTARKLGLWDLGGGPIIDVIKHKKLSTARKEISKAQSYIRQARDFVDILEDIHIDFQSPDFFKDVIFDNFIFNMVGDIKICWTKESVQQAYNKVRQMGESLIGLLRIRKQKRKIFIIKINEIRKKIMEERELLL
ncbi:MAG: hypothetical protein KGD63_00055 [Candidatus Lokiarchaeota archaeon]|nr:hypothetical protein [Candidatus Lokiarchaeota archaeon]